MLWKELSLVNAFGWLDAYMNTIYKDYIEHFNDDVWNWAAIMEKQEVYYKNFALRNKKLIMYVQSVQSVASSQVSLLFFVISGSLALPALSLSLWSFRQNNTFATQPVLFEWIFLFGCLLGKSWKRNATKAETVKSTVFIDSWRNCFLLFLHYFYPFIVSVLYRQLKIIIIIKKLKHTFQPVPVNWYYHSIII